ncbi:MAG TPA: NifB/NifX family molybdenum-iron cluster-binding protein, partial [Candidatus Ozemobacteraceae bacterium]|nr:NifB/NifX family molybdenum-iron cluster-binding protein [Candidatus Ozemobacteraceae bacterium]
MRIGIPIDNGILCPHFGRCDEFALVDVDETRQIIRQIQITHAPEHEPGVRPRWLIQNGVKIAIVGGIGERAR